MVVVGDLHGALKEMAHKLDKYKFWGQDIVQVGDFGLGFLKREQDIANLTVINSILQLHNTKLYIVRGNHDDPYFWSEFDGRFSNIDLVKDWSTRTIEANKVLFVGGGISIDRRQRTEGVSYWKDEEVRWPTNEEWKNIEAFGPEIIVSHIAPTIAFPREVNDLVREYAEIEKYHDSSSDLLLELSMERMKVDGILPLPSVTHWYYGHYHRNNVESVSGVEFRCLGISSWWDTNKKDYINDGY